MIVNAEFITLNMENHEKGGQNKQSEWLNLDIQNTPA